MKFYFYYSAYLGKPNDLDKFITLLKEKNPSLEVKKTTDFYEIETQGTDLLVKKEVNFGVSTLRLYYSLHGQESTEVNYAQCLAERSLWQPRYPRGREKQEALVLEFTNLTNYRKPVEIEGQSYKKSTILLQQPSTFGVSKACSEPTRNPHGSESPAPINNSRPEENSVCNKTVISEKAKKLVQLDNFFTTYYSKRDSNKKTYVGAFLGFFGYTGKDKLDAVERLTRGEKLSKRDIAILNQGTLGSSLKAKITELYGVKHSRIEHLLKDQLDYRKNKDGSWESNNNNNLLKPIMGRTNHR